MKFKNIITTLKALIIDMYNELVNYIKKFIGKKDNDKKDKINKQSSDQNIHIVKAKVKRVRIKNNEN